MGNEQEGVIITTNGTDVANPVVLAKFANARVNGTMVYPNALAGLILMLLPAALVLAFNTTRSLKSPIRFAVIGLAIFLGGATFFWTGSKLGWLLAMFVAGLFLFRLDWPVKLKVLAVAAILVLGLGVFAVRFHHYFAKGATSVSARFDYWRAAVQTTTTHPLLGTGPGTFQRPACNPEIARRRNGPPDPQRLSRTPIPEFPADCRSGLDRHGLLYVH